ncbi:hypothetical protein [Streptomyces sp. NBC_01750]|uniref:hypothetical protein n=1 Tax=Streptomyces sp. NBC_01750 TaxID=2975928 RepID=UPI002DD7F075|nr:hypothetical protein [Streptomyces sp. NBC_01750]WSD38084.1 hypothetical protein OG966_39135 [Streptomyces sp. NBC_01750]
MAADLAREVERFVATADHADCLRASARRDPLKSGSNPASSARSHRRPQQDREQQWKQSAPVRGCAIIDTTAGMLMSLGR